VYLDKVCLAVASLASAATCMSAPAWFCPEPLSDDDLATLRQLRQARQGITS
jgi:hypothetical protein